jgi:hypothetical protein
LRNETTASALAMQAKAAKSQTHPDEEVRHYELLL